MNIVVLGSGNWGLALALCFSEMHKVSLWAKDENEAEKAKMDLAQCQIGNKENVSVQVKYSVKLASEDILIVAVPSGAIPSVTEEITHFLQNNSLTIVSVSKGLIQPGFKTISQVLKQNLPQCPIGVITGPTIANELLASKPAKAVLAAYDVETLMRLKDAFRNNYLHYELSLEVKEVEFCASLKGVIAIGAGIADGLDLGRNFLGLLLTYGIYEFLEIGKFLGISTQHILSIAGLGDLIATCWSSESRNHQFGKLLSQSIPTKDALSQVGMVVEGVRCAQDITALASLNVMLPLICSIAQVIEQPTTDHLNVFKNTVLDYKGIL